MNNNQNLLPAFRQLSSAKVNDPNSYTHKSQYGTSNYRPNQQTPNQTQPYKYVQPSYQHQSQKNKQKPIANQRVSYENQPEVNGALIRRTSSRYGQNMVKVPEPLKISMRYVASKRSNEKKQQNPQQYVNNVIKNVFLLNKCQLCETNSEKQLLSVSKCQHKYCQDCLNQYVTHRISINELIVCPDENCHKQMDENGKFFHDLPENLKNKYKNLKLWKQTQNNQNVRLCPRQKCKGGLVDLLLDPPACKKCGKTFCKQCELEAHAGPCQNAFQKKFNDWKRCPKCRVFIEKTQGCNHMTCTCGHQFCYVCLENWQTKHYACGGAQQLYNFQQFEVPNGFCERILLITIYLISIPLLIILAFVAIPIFMIIFGIFGFFALPCAIMCNSSTNGRGLQVCCPILAVIGFIIGAIGGIGVVFVFILGPTLNKLKNRLIQICESFGND